jgi:hypothetical protein
MHLHEHHEMMHRHHMEHHELHHRHEMEVREAGGREEPGAGAARREARAA